VIMQGIRWDTAMEFGSFLNNQLSRWGKGPLIELVEGGYDGCSSFKIYTATYKYTITARAPKGDRGYLGCIASARMPRAGEDWTRGNDLPDGPFTIETWHRILTAILAFELVTPSTDMVVRWSEPDMAVVTETRPGDVLLGQILD
jgi:hypothetical protein